MDQHIQSYKEKLIETLSDKKINKQIEKLYNELFIAWKNKRIFFYVEMKWCWKCHS